jgi:hypothetical protein
MIEDLLTWIYTKTWTQEGKNEPRILTHNKRKVEMKETKKMG